MSCVYIRSVLCSLTKYGGSIIKTATQFLCVERQYIGVISNHICHTVPINTVDLLINGHFGSVPCGEICGILCLILVQ